MADKQDFPFPLDTDIEEDIPVRKNKFDPATGKVYSVVELEKQKVRYINAPPEKHRCKPGDHTFIVINLKRSIFGCTKCQYSRMVYPTKYRYDEKTKKLINKFTQEVL